MRKILVFEFVTLDGVMQAPGGKDEDRDGGFEHGGWTVPYWHDDIGRNFFELMKDVDALLLGRRTYVTHAEASWRGTPRDSVSASPGSGKAGGAPSRWISGRRYSRRVPDSPRQPRRHGQPRARSAEREADDL
jgi:hypothetical protein